MTEFSIYDLTTKEIIRHGRSARPDTQAREGEGVILEKGDAKTQLVDDSGPEPVFVAKPSVEVEAVELAEALNRAKRQLAAAIRSKRLEFITDLPGQGAVYQEKKAEARRYTDDPNPDLANYPLLSAEVGLTAPTAQELATLWLTMDSAWVVAAAQIEQARMTAKAALASATTKSDVDTAMLALRAALDTVQPPTF